MMLRMLHLSDSLPARVRKSLVVGCAGAFVALWLAINVFGASAETRFVATIDGASTVPPNGSPATGTAVFLLDDAEINIDYTIEFSGLLGVELASHIHNAPPDSTGSVVFPLPVGSPKTGTWPFVTPTQVAELFAGNLYVNSHTTDFTGGEIRGNLHLAITPVEPSTWGRIKALYH